MFSGEFRPRTVADMVNIERKEHLPRSPDLDFRVVKDFPTTEEGEVGIEVDLAQGRNHREQLRNEQ